MNRSSWIISAALHLAVALLAWFGLPHFLREPPQVETPIIVDLVPIGEKTNPPPAQDDTPQPEEQKPEPKPAPAPPPPPPPPAPPPPPPPPAPPAPPPPPPKPEPAPKPPEPKPPEPKPEPKPVPKPSPSDLKPKPKPADEFDSLLKSVDKLKPKPKSDLDSLLKTADKLTPPPDAKGNQPKPQQVRGSASNNPLEPVSMTETDAIRAHVEKCWSPPAGAKDADKLIVAVRVYVLPDGQVTDAKVEASMAQMADSFYMAAADSARRAVRTCSPLPIPRNKFENLKDGQLVLQFDLAKALGRR